ncbi:peptidase [Aspergillus indologenus CBS 114.80]|uniref:Peptidase n=1 Tax=Aspergillus indologenus CBS 114.80 TaxID=1450541 RepID=A0A2V5JCI6_9EURO|nr:peptidase [Aspergillus indologenus CBS 114.80]
MRVNGLHGIALQVLPPQVILLSHSSVAQQPQSCFILYSYFHAQIQHSFIKIEFVYTIFTLIVLPSNLLGQPISEGSSQQDVNPSATPDSPLREIDPNTGVDDAIATLLQIGVDVITLDKTISALQLTKDSIPLLQSQTRAITNSLDTLIAQTLLLSYLDPVESTRVTANTVILKPTYTHLLKVISEQASVVASNYCKEMHDWLGQFRIDLLFSTVTANAILVLPDAALSEAAWGVQDREFPPVIAAFHGPYS